MGAWNWLDWTLTVIVVTSVAGAVQKGFVRELISLASLVEANRDLQNQEEVVAG